MMMQSLFEPKVERSLYPFRWYQEPFIPKITEAMKQGHLNMIAQAPCGTGKTVISAHLVDRSMRKGNNVLFACPRISLVDQTYESFRDQGIRDIGIIQANNKRTDPRARLQIACFDSLYSRAESLPHFDFAIIDEVHLADERMWKLIKNWKVNLGFTATPWKKGLGLHFSKLVVLTTIHEMLEYHEQDPSVGLVPVRGIGPSPLILAGIEGLKKGEDGDFQEKSAAAFMDRKEVMADIVETWLKTRQDGSHPGYETFLFARTRANAVNLQEAFAAQGVKFGYIDAFTNDRDPIFEAYERHELAGIASVGCLSTGVDRPVRSIVDAAPRRNEADIVQALGRMMRPAENKPYAWLNDHVGNANRFGWFADIHHEKLDDTPPHIKGSAYEQEEAAPRELKRKECAVCRNFLPRGALRCPTCGTQIVFDDTVTIKGDLVDLRKMKAEKKAKKELAEKEKAARAEKKKQGEPQAFYSGLLDFALRRGFKEGWAANKFHEHYGHWPNGLNKVPMTPRKVVRDFISESAKKWRAQKKAEAMNAAKA